MFAGYTMLDLSGLDLNVETAQTLTFDGDAVTVS